MICDVFASSNINTFDILSFLKEIMRPVYDIINQER